MGYFSESKCPESLRVTTVNMVLIHLQGFHLDESEGPPGAEHVSKVTAMNISSQRGARALTFLAKEQWSRSFILPGVPQERKYLFQKFQCIARILGSTCLRIFLSISIKRGLSLLYPCPSFGQEKEPMLPLPQRAPKQYVLSLWENQWSQIPLKDSWRQLPVTPSLTQKLILLLFCRLMIFGGASGCIRDFSICDLEYLTPPLSPLLDSCLRLVSLWPWFGRPGREGRTQAMSGRLCFGS